MKSGDVVRVKEGILYAGKIGRVMDVKVRALREARPMVCFDPILVKVMFDESVIASYDEGSLEKLPRWRSIDD